MDAEEQEAFALLVVAAVGVQHFPDLSHHVGGLHGGGGLHAPGEAQGSRLGVAAPFVFGIARCTPERNEKGRDQILHKEMKAKRFRRAVQ